MLTQIKAHKLVVLEAGVLQGVWHHHHCGLGQAQGGVTEGMQAVACMKERAWGEHRKPVRRA